ncbi:hypothetical protein RYX36_028154 [Vicia faba]
MRSDGLFPDSRLLGFLVSSFAFVHRFDVSNKFIADALCNKVDVNVVVYNNFLNILVKCNRLDEAVSLFRELVRFDFDVDIFTFNILIQGFCVAGEIEEAFRFLNNMRSFGCYPDVVSYNTLIHGLCRIYEVDRARDLLREICLRTEFAPNVLSYTIVISGYCKLSKMKEASSIFDEMITSGAKPSVATFNAVIYRFVKSDIVPRPFIYNLVIDGYCKSGNVDEANAIVVDMENKCKPDKLTFTILIIGHCMKGRAPEAIGIFYKMLATGCSPDEVTIRTLSSCLLKSGMPSEAASVKEALFKNQKNQPHSMATVIESMVIVPHPSSVTRSSLKFSRYVALKLKPNPKFRPIFTASPAFRNATRTSRVVCEAQDTAVDVAPIMEANWQSLVLESDSPVLVEFWAPWCGPCRMIHPILDELEKQYAGKLKCYKLNTDESPSTATR